MNNNITKPENTKELKDGRKAFTTNNGFRKFIIDQKGGITQVTDQYYNKALKHTFNEKFTPGWKKKKKIKKF